VVYRALVATLFVGCYSPRYDNCTIRCGTTGCPSGYQCDTQAGMCSLAGTTCSGAGDASHDSHAGSDAATSPGDASLASCTYFQHLASEVEGMNLVVPTPTFGVSAGDMIVVAISAHMPPGVGFGDISDDGNNTYIEAVTEISGNQLSAIYYVPASTDVVNNVSLHYSATVGQVADLITFHCTGGIRPAVVATSSSHGVGGAATAGQLALAAPRLVVSSAMTDNLNNAWLVDNTTIPQHQILDSSFMENGTNIDTTFADAQGPIGAGTTIVPYQGAQGGVAWIGTAAAFNIAP